MIQGKAPCDTVCERCYIFKGVGILLGYLCLKVELGNMTKHQLILPFHLHGEPVSVHRYYSKKLLVPSPLCLITLLKALLDFRMRQGHTYLK